MSPLIYVLDVSLRFFDRTRATKNYSADAIFPNFVAGKELNKNFTEKSVAKAKLPSNFPIFPKFFLISQNPRNSEKCGLPHFSRLGFWRRKNFALAYLTSIKQQLKLRLIVVKNFKPKYLYICISKYLQNE